MISIVTGTRNRPESFQRFLESVVRCATVPTELVVSDASGEPYAEDAIDALPESGLVTFVCIRESEPLGHVAGYNVAFAQCTQEWVAWFNDDCEMLPGWDKVALDYMTQHPEIGIGGVYFQDHAGRGPEGRSYVICSYIGGIKYANFGVCKRVLGENLGWFDPQYYFYAADTDISYSAIDSGYAVVGIPECRVKHYRDQDEQRVENLATARQQHDARKFDEKWKPRLALLQETMKKYSHLPNPKGIPAPESTSEMAPYS